MLLVTIDPAWATPSSPMDLDMADVHYTIHAIDVEYVALRDSGLADRDPDRYNTEIEALLQRRWDVDAMRESVEREWGPVVWDDRPLRPRTPRPRRRPTAAETAKLASLRAAASAASPDAHPFDVLFMSDSERASYDAAMEAASPLWEEYEAYHRELTDKYETRTGVHITFDSAL